MRERAAPPRREAPGKWQSLGLTGKAWLLPVDADFFSLPFPTRLARLDALAAERLSTLDRPSRLADLKGDADPEGAIKDFRQEIRHDHQALMQRLTDSLTRGEDLQAADCVRKLKFVDKLLEELERFEDSLFES